VRSWFVAVVLLVAACGGARQGEQPASTQVTAAPERPAAAPTEPPQPTTYAEGDRIVMPVTFTDGTTAEITYSAELGLAEREPFVSAGWGRLDSPSTIGRDFVVYRVGEGWSTQFAHAEPIATYEGFAGATVPFHRGDAVGDREADYLVFRFGGWEVAVYDYAADGELAAARMTEDERATFARSLVGRTTADGFLVLDSRPPLRLAHSGDDGPSVGLGFGAIGDESIGLRPGVDCVRSWRTAPRTATPRTATRPGASADPR
jgi:hypothetical protein